MKKRKKKKKRRKKRRTGCLIGDQSHFCLDFDFAVSNLMMTEILKIYIK